MTLRRLTLAWAVLLSVVCGACRADLVGPPPATDRASLFDELWREFDLHYSFFELKGIDWNAARARHRPAALAATSDREFAAALAAMLAELRDVHVTLTPFGPGSTMRYLTPFDTTASGMSEALIFSAYVTDAATTSGGHLRYGMLAPGVGYLRIPSFVGNDWAGEVDEALGRMTSATAMVVDVRGNGGGSRAVATDIAGRFADRVRTFGYLRYRNGPGHGDFTDFVAETVEPRGARRFSGPVVVLTSRRDYSSAEDFVLAMRSLPRTTVVGDTTGGASGGPIVRELANGWTYQISQWIEYTPARQVFEGIGLAPDVVVKSGAASLATNQDVVIDRALAIASVR